MTGEPGPLPEEVVRLIGAAQDWWHRTVGDPATARIANGAPATARIATGAPECCWCPLCQLIATLRGERPELLERLSETQTALTAALRALADAAGVRFDRPAGEQPAEAGPDADEPESESRAGRSRSSRVQPIPLDDEAG
jgi:hypothetical protein